MMKKYCKGFTLSELLLAAAILAFVLAGLLALFIKCLSLNDSNRNLTVAVTHAQYIMEEIKDACEQNFALAQANITNGNWNLSRAQLQSAPYNLSALNDETISTAVTQSANPLGVSVTVSWKDANGRQRNTQLDTLFPNYK